MPRPFQKQFDFLLFELCFCICEVFDFFHLDYVYAVSIEPLLEYYPRLITFERFMEELAPTHWPPSKRNGYCWLRLDSDTQCEMKRGDHLTQDFLNIKPKQLKASVNIVLSLKKFELHVRTCYQNIRWDVKMNL